MSSDTATIVRQLKIKSGVVRRLYKEHKSYVVEEEQQKIKLDKFIANGAEDWDIKNARKMLEESQKMIKDCSTRLGGATQDLRDYVVTVEKNPEIPSQEAYKVAREVLEEVSL